MQKTEVLIIGAGPTGLVLALWLTKIGVKVRIIDKAEKAGTTSRALVIHARNLEFYHQLGIVDLAVDNGVEFKSANIWVRGKKRAHITFGNLNVNISPYQYMLIFPQDEQEEMLEKELMKLGVHVERSAELVSFEETAEGILARINKSNGEKQAYEARYLAGCDGARSIVRQQIGATFEGGTYEDTFYVADVQIKGPTADGDMHIALDDADFLAIFPMKGKGRIRLVGAIREEDKKKQKLGWEDVSDRIIKRLRIQVEDVKWFSTYRVHHRVASPFRRGNVFLLGDAGHLHSPVGAQGMNTGIGDAVNLAWKIGAVIKENAPAKILDTYQQERVPFAKRLVASTDRAFAFASARSFFATQVRTHIMPRLIPLLFSFAAFRRFAFRTLSQTSITYRQSSLSIGGVGKIKAGDRLPWVKTKVRIDNYEYLVTLQWQAHVYGDMSASLESLCDKRGIKLHIYPWNAAAKEAGLKKNAVYIIRPDGYVGLVVPNVNLARISDYFDSWKIGQP